MINVNIHYTSKLKLEIVAGYLLLAFIWVFILYLVYKEREEKNVMERREIYWRKERKLTNSTFIQLLDLAAMGELVSGWTLDDYTAYQKKRMKVTALLQNLKNKQKDNQQRICINKVIYDCAHSSISETEPSDFDFYIIMKREIEEIPDELNPDLMLNITASELLIKVAKGEIDIQKMVRKQLSDRGIDDQRNWIGPEKARKYWEKYSKPAKTKYVRIRR